MQADTSAKSPIPPEVVLHTSLPHYARLWAALAVLILLIGSIAVPAGPERLEQLLIVCGGAAVPALFAWITYRWGQTELREAEQIRQGDYLLHWELNHEQSARLRRYLWGQSRSRLKWLLVAWAVGAIGIGLYLYQMISSGVDRDYAVPHALQLALMLSGTIATAFCLWWIVTFSARRAHGQSRGIVFARQLIFFGGIRIHVPTWTHRRALKNTEVDGQPTLLVELERRYRSRGIMHRKTRRYELPIPNGRDDDVEMLARHYAQCDRA